MTQSPFSGFKLWVVQALPHSGTVGGVYCTLILCANRPTDVFNDRKAFSAEALKKGEKNAKGAMLSLAQY